MKLKQAAMAIMLASAFAAFGANPQMEAIKALKAEVPNRTIELPGGAKLELAPITKHLFFGVYTVTQKQWNSLMSENPSRVQGDDYPVTMVSWNEFKEFIDKLNQHVRASAAGVNESVYFRFPTEFEWMYACRAGADGQVGLAADGTPGKIEDMAWFCDNSGEKGGGVHIHKVGEKAPNAFGLYDMHGNVWEWCLDGSNIPGQLGYCVIHGGSFQGGAGACGADYRIQYHPTYKGNCIGLRLAAWVP